MKELQLHCEDGSCKIALFVDGVNVLFESRTNIGRKLPTKRMKGPFKPQWTEESIAPDEFCIVRSIKKLLKGNSLIVLLWQVSIKRIHWSLHHIILVFRDGKLVETIVGGTPEKELWFP